MWSAPSSAAAAPSLAAAAPPSSPTQHGLARRYRQIAVRRPPPETVRHCVSRCDRRRAPAEGGGERRTHATVTARHRRRGVIDAAVTRLRAGAGFNVRSLSGRAGRPRLVQLRTSGGPRGGGRGDRLHTRIGPPTAAGSGMTTHYSAPRPPSALTQRRLCGTARASA